MKTKKEYFYDKIYTACPDLNIGILEGKAAVINDDGKPLTDFIYEDIYYGFEKNIIRKFDESNYFGRKDYLVVKKLSGKMGLINKHIQTIVDFIYDDISIEFGNNFDTYVTVQKNCKYGMNELEPVYKIVTDCIYEDIYFDYDAGIIAKKDGKYGILNTNGDIIENFEYDKIEPRYSTILFEKDKKYKIQKIENLEDMIGY